MRHNDPVNANNMPGGGYVIGVDFGTLSGRALVVRVTDGAELGTAVHEYRHGVMDTVLASSGMCCGMPCRLRSPTRASTPRR
jgi:L-ribulokinase